VRLTDVGVTDVRLHVHRHHDDNSVSIQVEIKTETPTRSHTKLLNCRKLQRQLRPGGILLLHDHLFAYSSTDESSRAETFAALD